MKKIKANKLPFLNIITSLVFLAILIFSKLSENVIYLMMMTLLIGWAIPYFVILLTGLSMLRKKFYKLGLIFNICNILLIIMLIIFCIRLFDKYFIILIVEYSIILIISIINIIFYIKYLKKHPNLENIAIKKAKKENNGAVL